MGKTLIYLSTYVDGNKRADVVYDEIKKTYGIEMFIDNELKRTEFFKGRSQAYAESAAENFVMGVKEL